MCWEVMRVGSMKFKTQIYILILGLVLTLIGMAVMRSCQDAPGAKAMTVEQELKALEKSAPQSPEMRKFLEQEKAQREANQEAAGDSPK